MNKRYKGTVDWFKERGPTGKRNRRKGTSAGFSSFSAWRVIVRDTETNTIVEEAVVKTKDIDSAVTVAKKMAKEWENKCSNTLEIQ